MGSRWFYMVAPLLLNLILDSRDAYPQVRVQRNESFLTGNVVPVMMNYLLKLFSNYRIYLIVLDYNGPY